MFSSTVRAIEIGRKHAQARNRNISRAVFEYVVYFNTHIKNVRSKIKDAKIILPSQREHLYQMCPNPPRLYGQIKIHKAGYPIRPVIAHYTDPTYHLAKYLKAWSTTITDFTPPCSVKNSIQLSSLLHNTTYSKTARLISFMSIMGKYMLCCLR